MNNVIVIMYDGRKPTDKEIANMASSMFKDGITNNLSTLKMEHYDAQSLAKIAISSFMYQDDVAVHAIERPLVSVRPETTVRYHVKPGKRRLEAIKFIKEALDMSLTDAKEVVLEGNAVDIPYTKVNNIAKELFSLGGYMYSTEQNSLAVACSFRLLYDNYKDNRLYERALMARNRLSEQKYKETDVALLKAIKIAVESHADFEVYAKGMGMTDSSFNELVYIVKVLYNALSIGDISV